jgi:autotransporter translocation and assembly factor TamB
MLESIKGPFAITATMQGTPYSPRLSGDAHLRGGYIKLLNFADPLENVQVDLALKQDTIVIERAEATTGQGKKGRIAASGTVRFESYNDLDYDVQIRGREVAAQFEFVEWEAKADFDLAVNGSSPPLMSGIIRPERFEDREPFDEDKRPRVEDTTLWDWDITVDVPSNYWIHNDRIEAELEAQIRILRQRGLINFIGEAEIIRGRVYFFDRVGRIERGILTFDDPTTPDPALDIDVVFRIQQPRVEAVGAGATSEVVDLRMHVGGRASEPLIQPEAPYTEEDVLLLLAANTTSGAGGDPFADRLRFAATGLVFSEVQRAAARRLGLETLEIESGGNAADTRITIGRYLSSQFYLYGASPVASSSGQEVGFEYRFSRRLYLEGNRDRDNNYRLNLHINWDY